MTRMSVADLVALDCGDYDGPVAHVMDYLRWDWDNAGEFPGDPEYAHAMDYAHDGPDNYVAYLAERFAREGIIDPLMVRGTVLVDGHHRAAAAIAAGLTHVPILYV